MRPVQFIYANICLLVFCCFAGCSSDTKNTNTRSLTASVVVHELSDPDMLNPVNSTAANSRYVENNIFLKPLEIDPETYDFYPSLAVSLPKKTVITEGKYAGGMSLEFEFRSEAVWDNGTPVTGYDYAFTVKAIKNPSTNASSLRPYLEFVEDIVVDANNPKKFTIYTSNTYMGAVSSCGTLYVIPEYIYDPNQIMRKFDFSDFNNSESVTALRSNPDIISFANDFNGEKYQREQGFIVGCGPYEFIEWVTGDFIRLRKKENWWGDQIRDQQGFAVNAPEIYYEIINDKTTVTSALKDQGLDVARGINFKEFVKLSENEQFKSIFNLHTPKAFSYVYIGLNTRNPKLEDVRVRKAIAHCIDRNEIIEILMYGLAEPTNSMVHPGQEHYNKSLGGYEFSIEKATALLDEAGWVDSDGDGIRDKMIDGELVPLKLEFRYNSGNTTRRNIGLFMKSTCRMAGIDMNIITKEWTVYLEELDNQKFEVFCGGWIGSPHQTDPKQIWHTEYAAIGGSNYVGYGDAYSDALIEKLRYEPNDSLRSIYFKELQQLTFDAVPYIFLYAPKERIVIHGRFDNAKASAARPGYFEKEFILNTNNMSASE